MRLRRPIPIPDHRVSWWPGAEMRIGQALPDVRGGNARHLFRVLFTAHPPVTSVRQIAARYQMNANTLNSRWHRAGLGSLADWIDNARLVRAAFLLDNRELSIAAVSSALRFPFPQGFYRYVLSQTGMTPQTWRDSVTGAELLDAFISRIEQHAEVLVALDLRAPYAPAYPTTPKITAGAA